MHCQRAFFWVFLFIYIVSGIVLGIISAVLHTTKPGSIQVASNISVIGRYYISAVAIYLFITGFIHLLITACCKKNFFCFGLPISLLIFGIIGEIIATVVIVIISVGNDPATRKKTMIMMGVLTGYLIVLQICGIIVSKIYHAQLRHNYETLPSK